MPQVPEAPQAQPARLLDPQVLRGLQAPQVHPVMWQAHKGFQGFLDLQEQQAPQAQVDSVEFLDKVA